MLKQYYWIFWPEWTACFPFLFYGSSWESGIQQSLSQSLLLIISFEPLSCQSVSFTCTLYNSSMFVSGMYLWNTWRSYECIVWLDSNELRTCVCSCCGSLVWQLAAAAGRLLPNVGSDQVAGAAIDHTPCVHFFHLLTPPFPRSRNSRSTGLPQALMGFASGIYSSGQPVKWTVYYISG